jgi:hypothetical protein
MSNSPRTPGASQSARMNFSEPDAVDAASLPRLLCLDRKGNTPMPPVHLVFRAVMEQNFPIVLYMMLQSFTT